MNRYQIMQTTFQRLRLDRHRSQEGHIPATEALSVLWRGRESSESCIQIIASLVSVRWYRREYGQCWHLPSSIRSYSRLAHRNSADRHQLWAFPRAKQLLRRGLQGIIMLTRSESISATISEVRTRNWSLHLAHGLRHMERLSLQIHKTICMLFCH